MRHGEELDFSGSLSLFVAVSATLFMLSSIIGCYVLLTNPQLAQVLNELLAIETVFKLSPLALITLILLNNGLKCLAAILLGPIFGIFPLLFVTTNGFVLGALSVISARARGPWFFLLAAAPHGVIEVPAVLLSAAVGLKEGWTFIKKLGGERVSLKAEVKGGLKLYLKAILPLMVLAALTEVFLTPIAVEGFFK